MRSGNSKAIGKLNQWCLSITLVLSLITFSGWITSSPAYQSQSIKTEVRDVTSFSRKRVVRYNSVRPVTCLSFSEEATRVFRRVHTDRLNCLKFRLVNTNFNSFRTSFSKLILKYAANHSDDYASAIGVG
ncbi:MAG TPA: hypothetical protein VGK59_09100 [Ohtaekwangia sp.]